MRNISDKSNINEDNFVLFYKPKTEKNLNNEKNIDNNDKDLELLLGQSPATLLGNTFCFEEDRIKNELSKINECSNISKIPSIEKIYVNTNEGNG